MEAVCAITNASDVQHGGRVRLAGPRAAAVLLALTVVFGGWLRLGSFDRVGIRFEDEAAYYADARLWYRCARVALDPLAVGAFFAGERNLLRERVARVGVRFEDRYEKPTQGFTAAGSVIMFAVGERPLALVLPNALAGTASILVIYLIGSAIGGSVLGLVAAVLLALSPYHLLYARGMLPDATATFFMLLGVWFWIRANQGERFVWYLQIAAGLTLGYALICHYRSGYVIGVLLLLDVARYSRELRTSRGRRVAVLLRRWAVMGFFVLLPAVSIEVLFRGGAMVSSLFHVQFPLRTFFESVSNQFGAERLFANSVGGGRFWSLNPGSLLGFCDYAIRMQGLAACIACVVGIAVLVRRGLISSIPAIALLVLVLLLCVQPFVVARGLSVGLPFFALCCASGIIALSRWIARSRVVAAAVVSGAACALVALPVVGRTREVLDRRSDLKAVGAFFAATDGGRAVVAENVLKYEVFFHGGVKLVGGRLYRSGGSPEAMLVRMREDGVRWVIADPQRWHYRSVRSALRERVFVWWRNMENLLRKEADLIFEVPHVADSRWEFLAEGPGLAYFDEMTRAGDGPIRIYDLRVVPDPSSRDPSMTPVADSPARQADLGRS